MEKLRSKLHKNGNNTDILISQIYLPKIKENILKYYGLNSFKRIANGSNCSLLTTSESSAHLSGGFPV